MLLSRGDGVRTGSDLDGRRPESVIARLSVLVRTGATLVC